MINNDVLKRLRFVFDLNDPKMIELFASGGLTVTRSEISNWMKKDDDAEYQACNDEQLATFLNGFITEKRGKRDGEQPIPEKKLTNNIILKKLTIALSLKAEDTIEVLQAADLRVSKHEISSFFRKVGHRQYRECKDQILRNFLMGLQLKNAKE